jgi:hypothetical protein
VWLTVGYPSPTPTNNLCLPSNLPSLVMSVTEESRRTVSLRESTLLRSSLVSLPSPGAISFRLKLVTGKAHG